MRVIVEEREEPKLSESVNLKVYSRFGIKMSAARDRGKDIDE